VLYLYPVGKCPFMWYKNIASRFFGLVTKHACDRRTDRQNYDSQDCASIASHGKKAAATTDANVVVLIFDCFAY